MATRTLHMPGAAVLHTDYRSPAYWAALRRADVPGETGTVVLEPTPAQLAAGIRVIEISADDAYAPLASLYDAARLVGWMAQIAQSRYLSEPGTGGKVERRGRRLEKVVQSLRVQCDPVRAYGMWEFDVERAKWSAAGGRCGIVTPEGMAAVMPLGVKGLERLIKGSEVV